MSKNREQNWRWWFLLPIYPYQNRPTIQTEVIKDQMWTFEQPHGLLYAVVSIRMTVVKLKGGGLLVYCPLAPTAQCVTMVRELENKHGKIKYIIHSTSSGLEHKIFVPPFARCFPHAEIYCVPSQWTFPLRLPLSWVGFPTNRTKLLPLDWRRAPFADDFEYQILDIDLTQGSFAEVAMYHPSSQTLLVTDTVIYVPEKPPEIVQLDPFPLLFHARERALDQLPDNEYNRLKGWQRICLFALYFRPSMIETLSIKQLWQDAIKAPDRSRKNYFGLYPFRWQPQWQTSFLAISNRLLVAPILESLILPQAPKKVMDWVNAVTKWNFKQVIPAHFEAPFTATPAEFKQAFSFLLPSQTTPEKLYPSGKRQIYLKDANFIRVLEKNLVRWGIAKHPMDN
ncbi:MAG: DUF4336 domain-containing protein [Cyanobacterium sp. T60_A2020_053]|nr:DUF4336 domain-containing protein [Cyanobacterium sp. T60_A2020_053]